MNQINAEFIERYQLLLQKDPSSRVFAPLAEAYRKMKLYKQALDVCNQGIELNPEFAPGYIARGRLFLTQKKFSHSHEDLIKACQLSSENLLAHELLAECELQLKNPKRALKAYKMVMFLNPTHERAQRAIKKLESLTADEYDDEVFTMEKLNFAADKMNEAPSDELEVEETLSPTSAAKDDLVERYISLVDAFIARNERQKAYDALMNAEKQIGFHPEIQKRRPYVMNKETSRIARPEAAEQTRPLPENTADSSRNRQLAKLQRLLDGLEEETNTSQNL